MKCIKIIGNILLICTSLYALDNTDKVAEGEQREHLKGKGFFAGIDIERVEADTRYDIDSQNRLYNIPDSTDTTTEPAFKLGYQYYYTRVYFKYSSLDEETPDYTVESKSYEFNVEYLPIFYRGDSYAIRGIFGTAIGYMDSDLKDLSPRLAQEAQLVGLNDRSDKQAVYGAQIGVMYEMSNGLNAELGYRYRRGNLLESDSVDGKVTFKTKRKQLYLGLNYLF